MVEKELKELEELKARRDEIKGQLHEITSHADGVITEGDVASGMAQKKEELDDEIAAAEKG